MTLQVELNTIAASFGCLSARASALHAHMLDRFLYSGDPRTAPALAAALAALHPTYTNAAAAKTLDESEGSEGSEGGEGAEGSGAKGPRFNEWAARGPMGPQWPRGALPQNPALEVGGKSPRPFESFVPFEPFDSSESC